MLLLILFALEVVTAAFLTWRARSAYADFIQEHRDKLDLPFLAPLSLWLMDRMSLADRFPEAVSRVHQVMVGLYGSKTALVRTRCFLIRMISLSVAVMTGCTLVGWLADGNAELLGYGLCLTAFLPFVLYKEQAGKLLKKKRQMLLELPEMLNQIVLLVNAGETVQKALLRCVDQKADVSQSPLLTELAVAAHEIRMNGSFAKAMEDFNKRCGVQEVSLFTTTLLLNYKRGGDELVMSLKELSVTLWDKRKSLAKTLGEEASSKMVFPMVLIFMVVMIIVAAPAILTMG